MLAIVITIVVGLVLAAALYSFGQAATVQAQANLAQQQSAGGQIQDVLNGLGNTLHGITGGGGSSPGPSLAAFI